MDQVALCQFLGETAGDPLQLAFGPVARFDNEPALGAAERHLDKRAFVAHQRGECLDFRLVYVGGIADAALDRLKMLGMDRPEAGKGIEPVTKTYAEPDHIGRIRHHDLFRKIVAKPVIRPRVVQRRHGIPKIRLD